MRAQVLEGGVIRIGDPISPIGRASTLTRVERRLESLTTRSRRRGHHGQVGEIPQTPLVGVVMGSQSDWETMRHAAEVLAELGIPHEAKVVSAHRTPERLFRYAREAEGRGPGAC